jgi:hypothetical protein
MSGTRRVNSGISITKERPRIASTINAIAVVV